MKKIILDYTEPLGRKIYENVHRICREPDAWQLYEGQPKIVIGRVSVTIRHIREHDRVISRRSEVSDIYVEIDKVHIGAIGYLETFKSTSEIRTDRLLFRGITLDVHDSLSDRNMMKVADRLIQEIDRVLAYLREQREMKSLAEGAVIEDFMGGPVNGTSSPTMHKEPVSHQPSRMLERMREMALEKGIDLKI